MDTFRKWLNKPKADDKSLLARFYHADRSLTAVASELDSFDGRAEPDRCSRLVGRLRQGQDKVLAITNLIMEELLGEDRDQRAFRAKFPDEVLQENLAGQLWFGAECLAAGSSIMNRETESREMRPLAQAVTKSLGNVRNLLRDQCLRNNVPNSKTLHLDCNDSTTEQLYESLKIFDRLFAEFELRYVSAMVQVKTKHEYEMQEFICVLFSETLQRALSVGLLEQDKVDAFDPALMFSIPRLAIIAGLVIYPKGPLNMDMSAEQLSEMFRPFRTILIKIRDLLRKLSKQDLLQLERLLCTNEEIQITVPVGTSSIEAPSPDQQNNNSNNNSRSICADGSTHAVSTDNQSHSTSEQRNNINNNISNNNNNISNSVSSHSSTVVDTQAPSTSPKKVLKSGRGSNSDSYASRYAARSPSMSSVSADSSAASTPTASPMASPTPSHSIASTSSVASTSTTSPQWSDDEDNDNAHDNLVHEAGEVNVDDDNDGDNENSPAELYTVFDIVDLASGYLIPNTNLGNLLQPQEVPLTDNFVASEDEFGNHQNADDVDQPTTSASVSLRRLQQNDYEQQHEQEQARKLQARRQREATCRLSVGSAAGNSQSASSASCSSSSLRRHSHHEHTSNAGDSGHSQHRHHHHHHSHGHGHHHHNHQHRHHHHRHRHHSKAKRCSLDGCPQAEDAANCVEGGDVTTTVVAASSNAAVVHLDTSSVDSSTTSSLSEGGPHDVALAVRTAGRKLKTIDNLLHRLFVCIAGVADQLQTNFASDLRQILRSVFLMNMSPAQEELDIPEKTKESELFEFRASENDVIQESGGSNQSIYSAEEVNPELDSVFNNNNHSGVSSARHSTGGAIQRGNTIDLGANGESSPDAATAARRNQIGRSRSLGDHEHNNTSVAVAVAVAGGGCSGSSRRAPNYANTTRQNNAILTLHNHQRNRNNSVGSNSPSSSSSSSESNSPVSGRTSSGFQHATRQPLSSCSSTGNNSNNNNIDTCYDNAASAGDNSTATITATDTTTGSPQPLSNGVESGAAVMHNARQAPPAWVPDDKAPRCMSCHTPFTAFRRRHHCRNCGGVFCGVCSNASAPLPKYGLTKAVRVCRDCYVREVRANTANSRRSTATHARAATTTAGGS